MLNLYQKLFKKLNNEVTYAAWKDCHNLSDFLDGDGDVDLLVHKEQKEQFENILNGLAFIKAKSKILNFPEVLHYYGYDENSGRICHLNIYYKMNTGASHLKAHKLPLESVVWENRFLNRYGIYEAKYWVQSIIYTLRHYLKCSGIIGSLLWIREKESYRKEYKYIADGLNKEGSKQVRKQFLKKSNLSLQNSGFEDLNLKVSLREYFKSRRIAKKLSEYRRLGEWPMALTSLKNFLSLLLIRLKSEKKIIHEPNVIAISGVDGAGKSTMTQEVKSWLEVCFNVKVYHVGTPPSTLLTVPLRFTIWLRGLVVGRGLQDDSSIKSEIREPSLIFSLRYLALAYERYQLCLKIHKKAGQGCIILTDRYTGLNLGKMDSPRIGTNWSGLIGIMGRLENQYYESIPKADLLLFLNVSVEVAKQRNRNREKSNKETDDEIEIRHKTNTDLRFNALNEITINADKTYDEVLRSIKKEVWNQVSLNKNGK